MRTFNYTLQREGNELTIFFEGKLDSVYSLELEDHLEPALKGVKKLVLDFQKLHYISSAGLRIILTCKLTMNEQGEMKIRNIDPQVMQVLSITGFANDIIIE